VAVIEDIRADMVAEQDDLDSLVAGLDPEDWSLPTPAEGWSVRDQIGHLAYFDGAAFRALTAPDQFRAEAQTVLAQGADFVEQHLEQARSLPVAELLGSWRQGRQDLLEAVAGADAGVRVPWYGPPMSLASFASARLMEAWAHALPRSPAPASWRLGPTARTWSTRWELLGPQPTVYATSPTSEFGRVRSATRCVASNRLPIR
jgi:hypothetical protein